MATPKNKVWNELCGIGYQIIAGTVHLTVNLVEAVKPQVGPVAVVAIVALFLTFGVCFLAFLAASEGPPPGPTTDPTPRPLPQRTIPSEKAIPIREAALETHSPQYVSDADERRLGSCDAPLEIEVAVIEGDEITVRGRVGPEGMDLDESRAVLGGLHVELQVFDRRDPTAPLPLRAERILDPAATSEPPNGLTGTFEQSGSWILEGFIPTALRSSETFRAEVRLMRDAEVCRSYQMTIQR
ncbi:MAG: hypothetical protein MI919_05180 [Holophagales bacterium]|nr:hypothetical protein [Holophagales bacterium]